MNTRRLVLPLPPSVNNLFANVRGRDGRDRRVTTREYQSWQWAAGLTIKAARLHHVDGRYAVRIRLPARMAGDIDNRVKPILDALVDNRVTDDDRHCASVHVRRCARVPVGEAHVAVRGLR